LSHCSVKIFDSKTKDEKLNERLNERKKDFYHFLEILWLQISPWAVPTFRAILKKKKKQPEWEWTADVKLYVTLAKGIVKKHVLVFFLLYCRQNVREGDCFLLQNLLQKFLFFDSRESF
jgi:hypothetical protein